MFFGFRLPKSEHVDQLEEFQNENGLCCQSMQDLQKVLVCLELHGSNMEKADKRFIATAAGFSGFSPKVSDAIGAQPDWRRPALDGRAGCSDQSLWR